METVNNKKIWIVGASSGIGEHLAIQLAQQGAKLILSARRKKELEAIASNLDGEGHHVLCCDVADYQSIKSASEKLDTVDSVIFMSALYSTPDTEKTSIETIQNIIQVNVMGAYHLIDLVTPKFQQQGYGQIILCGSVAGYCGFPYGQPYSSTKSAIGNLAESLHTELKPKNIDVKLISPGFVRTALTDQNDFEMPMIINAKDAAEEIVKGITKPYFEIHFPKLFTVLMKILRHMPYWLFFRVSKRMLRKEH